VRVLSDERKKVWAVGAMKLSKSQEAQEHKPAYEQTIYRTQSARIAWSGCGLMETAMSNKKMSAVVDSQYNSLQ